MAGAFQSDQNAVWQYENEQFFCFEARPRAFARKSARARGKPRRLGVAIDFEAIPGRLRPATSRVRLFDFVFLSSLSGGPPCVNRRVLSVRLS